MNRLGTALIRLSYRASPVRFSKLMTAMELAIRGAAAGVLRDQGCQMSITAAITTAPAATAGPRIFFKLNCSVISRDVRGVLLGATLSVVGKPRSMLSSWARSSSALWYLFSFSFSRHLRTRRLEVEGDLGVELPRVAGVSLLCLTPMVNGVSPSNGTRPVSIS